ncbi:MAG: hypothetical protein AWU57_1497 [Marinobacter sp. T13-3]|nr:MAG: hypothetical protein AWU57_1497 [Marinobacter sp. T13-3]
MNLKGLLQALVPTLLLVGFLTNSVLQRILGPVEGNVVWPAVLLALVTTMAFMLIRRIIVRLSSEN